MYSKVLTVAAVCVVCVLAAPPTDVVPLEKQQPTVIPIVSQSEELEENGTFKFSYETGNGIKREEEAYVKIVPKAKSRSASSDEGGESDEDSNEIHVQRGSYSYTAPDGTVISVSYIADENGFQPIGDHIPRVPSAVPASSSEKSGKLLKPSDSAVSASEPKKQKKPAPAPASAPAPVTASAPAPAASAPEPAANPSASDGKPEEPPKEATTEKSNENTEKPASEESLSESTSNPTSIQPTSAEATEASASTSAAASDEKQTTTNPITEAGPTSEAENPSTTSSTPSSGEESSTTTTAS